MNACRLLTRIFPYLFELEREADAAGASDELIAVAERYHSLFWGPESRATRLVTDLGKLLFYRGLTLPDVVSDLPGVHYVIWYACLSLTRPTGQRVLGRMQHPQRYEN